MSDSKNPLVGLNGNAVSPVMGMLISLSTSAMTITSILWHRHLMLTRPRAELRARGFLPKK